MRNLLVLAVVCTGLLMAADVTGNWSAKVETGAGSGSPSFVLKQSGTKLTGNYSGQFGEAPLTGTLQGNDIEFKLQVKVEGADTTVTYKGKVTGDNKMSGTVVFGTMGEGTWEATKK